MKTLVDREDFIFKPPELGCVLSLSELPGGSGKVYDRSPYGNIGTITGATWVRLPSGLWCLSFDGNDDYVDCGAVNSLAIEDKDCSLVGWFYPTNGVSRVVFGGESGGLGLYLFNDAGNMNLTKLGISDAPNATSTLTLDAWGFLVVTFDSHSATNNLKYYINGSLDSSVTFSIDFTAGAKTRSIGCQYLGATRHFEGKMGLVRIYNRLLSALEIQNHFNREKHLFGRW